jgi:hypothetical protein
MPCGLVLEHPGGRSTGESTGIMGRQTSLEPEGRIVNQRATALTNAQLLDKLCDVLIPKLEE